MFSRHERSSPRADWDNETGRPEETDGENPEGSIGQDGSKCVKQDGTSLSPTSSTPKVRSSTASRRTPFRRHHEPGEPATAGARRAELVKILGIVVLAAVLMGLTSWVVASISTWLVPVYVTAMVLIFVIPQVQHLGEPEPAGKPAGVSADRASEATSPASSGADSPGATTLEVDGSPEASATGAKPPGSPTPKRRRTRGQGRKPVKPGPEPAVTISPAAWIRIGPGKFVRADSQDQGDASAPVPHTPLEAAEASIEAKSCPPDLVEDTDPNTVSTAVDVPNWADLNESGPSPERGTPSEEPAAIADPEPGSSVVALVLKADVGRPESDSTAAPATIAIDEDSSADSIDVGRPESDSTAALQIAIDEDSSADSIDVGTPSLTPTAPATIAIDEDFPADSIVAEPVTEEYGITPSAFGPVCSKLPWRRKTTNRDGQLPQIPPGRVRKHRSMPEMVTGTGAIGCGSSCDPACTLLLVAFLDWRSRGTAERSLRRKEARFRRTGPRGKLPCTRHGSRNFGRSPELTAVINPTHHRRVPD